MMEQMEHFNIVSFSYSQKTTIPKGSEQRIIGMLCWLVNILIYIILLYYNIVNIVWGAGSEKQPAVALT